MHTDVSKRAIKSPTNRIIAGLPYICFRRVPIDVREEAQNRETEITMKNTHMESYRTIPDFTAAAPGLGEEIRWKEYSYGETSDPV